MAGSETTEIKPLGDEGHHYWRVVAMAKATGVDLQQALETGRISQQDWAALVNRCRGCDWERDGGCGRWLKLALAEDVAREAPSTCVNDERFKELVEDGYTVAARHGA